MRTITIFLLLFIPFLGFSQSIQSIWSEPLNKEKGEELKKIIPLENSGYGIIRMSKKNSSFGVTLLDSNSKMLFENTIDIAADRIVEIDRVGNKITVFATKFNSETKEDELSYYQLNEQGKVSSTLLLHKTASNGGYHGNYEASISPDKKTVGIICERAYSEGKNEIMDVLLYDEQMQKITEKEHAYSFPSLKRRANVPIINNNGILYIGKRIRIKTENNYYLTVIGKSTEEENEMKLRNRKIADVNFDLLEDGSLVVAGFYSSYGKVNFEGAFNMKFKESSNPEHVKEYLLPENIITNFKNKKDISKSGYGLDKFHIRKVLATEKGSSYLIAEHLDLSKEEGTLIDSRDGAVIIKYSPTGDFMWAVPVLTNQDDEVHEGYWSSASFYGNDTTLYVVYNMVGNADKKIMNQFTENTEIGSMVIEIDPNGKENSYAAVSLFEGLSEKISLRTQCYLQHENNIVVVAENSARDKFYLGKITHK